MADLIRLAGESAVIINEHYDVEDYVKRRCAFLGSHPEYARVSNGLFAIARRDAGDVFKHEDEELSVQEVRRRELAAGIDDPLPLPTTDNTETIDDFASYPPCEWAPGLQWSAPVFEDSDGDPDTIALAVPSLPTVTSNNLSDVRVSPRTDLLASDLQQASAGSMPSQTVHQISPTDANITSNGPQRPVALCTPVPQHNVSHTPNITDPGMRPSEPSSQTSMQSMLQPANNYQSSQQTPSSSINSFRHNGNSAHSSSPVTGSPNRRLSNQSLMTQATSYLASSPEAYSPGPPQTANFHRRELMGQIIDALGKPAGTQRLQSLHSIDREADPRRPSVTPLFSLAASLANRGVKQPIKYKQGTKRRASEALETTEIVGHDEHDSTISSSPSTDSRPTKMMKFKLHGPRPLSSTTPSSPRPQALKPKAKAKTPPAPAKSHLEAVIAGKTLPKTPAEAKKASNIRHQRVRQHRVAAQAPNIYRRKTTEPDMLPEFFNPNNFPPGAAGDNEVRCVCGVTFDDGQHMVGCESCRVWQHNKCMGKGVPVDLTSTDYYCQMCDPYAHRELIARLRRQSVLV